MSLSKIKIVVLVALAVAGVVASLAIRHRAEDLIRDKEEVLGRQADQLAGMAAEHERLSKLAAKVKSPALNGQALELERLRKEAEQLRNQTNDLGRLLAQSRGSRKLLGVPSSPPGYQYSPEDYARRKEMTAGKEKDAANLSRAFWDFYRKHQEQFPSSLDQLGPYLEAEHISLTGTNEFEMIYPGPQDGLTNYPTQMLAVIRERQVWQAPSGRWARVYGMLTAPPRIVETDDNFQSWEAEHIIPPQGADQ